MQIVELIGYSGTFVFALTGALKARKHQMDIFGAVVLAFATAYGGGTIRDLLLGIHPVNWINDYPALLLVLGAVAVVFLLHNNVVRFNRFIFFSDAIGIGLFTVMGIEVSIRHGVNNGYAIIMGVISATFGGLLADMISNQVPTLLRRGELYATVCLAGGFLYVLLQYAELNRNFNLLMSVCSIVGLRIYSKRKQLSLPEI